MAKDYKHLGQPAAPEGKTPPSADRASQLPAFLSGLGLGLLVALGSYLLAPRQPPSEVTVKRPPPSQETRQPAANTTQDQPRPKYDFYRILEDREVSLSEWTTDEHDDTPPAADADATTPGLLILQIGSFQSFTSADMMKAQLELIGINAKIQRVVINGQDVRYRVRTNPYQDAEILQAARQHLLERGIEHVLLTLRAQD